MAKKVFYDDDARRRVLGGAEVLYKAVKTTMGPKGRNVVIGNQHGHPTVTHDGVTVAKNLEMDKETDETLGYSVGAQLIKEAANKLNDTAGDGTTTVTVLTYHILNEANKLIAAGHNPMQLRTELEEAAKSVLKKLIVKAEKIDTDSPLVVQVGSISGGDKAIGELVAEVIKTVGQSGLVTVEAGQGLALESEIVQGFKFDKGFVSPYMVSDEARMEAVVEKPAIIITDQKVLNIVEFLPLLEKLSQTGKKDIVLIAEEIGQDPLSVFIVNKLKGVINIVAVSAPGYGDDKTNTLEDIAMLTGGQVISASQGMTFETAELEMLGSARKVIVGKDETTIIEGHGDVTDRIKQLTLQRDKALTEFEAEALQKRQAALSGKIAVIKVGGTTETEIEERKYRVDDAVAAVKAALAEGIVPGGGSTLYDLAVGLDTTNGGRLLGVALLQPFRILMENAGLKPDEWAVRMVGAKWGFGIDVSSDKPELVDMKEAGIIDPVRVTREAIESAVSIAGTAITMGALVVDVKEDN